MTSQARKLSSLAESPYNRLGNHLAIGSIKSAVCIAGKGSQRSYSLCPFGTVHVTERHLPRSLYLIRLFPPLCWRKKSIVYFEFTNLHTPLNYISKCPEEGRGLKSLHAGIAKSNSSDWSICSVMSEPVRGPLPRSCLRYRAMFNLHSKYL